VNYGTFPNVREGACRAGGVLGGVRRWVGIVVSKIETISYYSENTILYNQIEKCQSLE